MILPAVSPIRIRWSGKLRGGRRHLWKRLRAHAADRCSKIFIALTRISTRNLDRPFLLFRPSLVSNLGVTRDTTADIVLTQRLSFDMPVNTRKHVSESFTACAPTGILAA